MLSRSPRSAFTLIELLVVIAIIAILAVVVVLTLNPAELLRQARDSQRLSDLNTINTALNLYSVDQGGALGFSLGSSSVTYLSVSDPAATTLAGSDCSGIGFPAGGAFHCPASSTLKSANGSGWAPVNLTNLASGAPISNLPVDPVNTTSSNLYYTYQTDGTTYKLRAVPESQKYLAQAASGQTPFTAGSNSNLGGGSGWVLVPGNSTFGTNNFWVMKYDAVCSDGKGNYLNDYDSGNRTYGDVYKSCTVINGRAIASLPGGWPITYIIQANAAAYCSAIGAHLITNNEWQTIAWNAEGVATNWSGGSVGSGSVYVGHSDGLPLQGSAASPSDSQGYYGTNGPYTGGGTGAAGSNVNQLRTLTLSNGSVVWDLAGNVYQWTNDTITGTNEPHGPAAGSNYIEFTAVTTWGTMAQATIGPANSSWNSTQGMGELYSENAVDGNTTGFIRGGFWSSIAIAGVESLYLGLNPTLMFNNVGFRCSR